MPLIAENDPSSRPSSDEGEILSLLRLIRHPCLVRLLVSYTHNSTYNLLLPRADCDLQHLLERGEPHPIFQEDHCFYQALQGLCSALSTVHDYTCPEFNLKMKGYHHDLKPENILVYAGKLVLSDFGLSNLKDASHHVQTMSNDTTGYYIAPECPSVLNNFEPTHIGQESDIWALGCIFVVMLTYLHHKAEGVRDFDRLRRATIGRWTTFQFHHNGKVNLSVKTWMQKLAEDTTAEGRELLNLAGEMLAIEPGARPSARAVSARLDLLALTSLLGATVRRLEATAETTAHVGIDMELERLRNFSGIFGTTDTAQPGLLPPDPALACPPSSTVQPLLLGLYESLDTAGEPTTNSLSSSLRRQIEQWMDKLWATLPRETRERLNRNLEHHFLSTTDVETLESLCTTLGDSTAYRNLRLKAVTKRMILLLQNPNPTASSHLLQERPGVQPLDSELGKDFRFGFYEPYKIQRDTGSWSPALVEWLEYNSRITPQEQAELQVRAGALAEMLASKDKPASLRCLPCTGYYHDINRHAFGFIFEMPPVLDGISTWQKPLSPVPLSALLRGRKKEQEQMTKNPSITHRFQLAKRLAAAVLAWHEVGWMHRGFSAFNIVFSGREPWSITEPYLMGFSRSRPDEENNFTMGPPEDPEQKLYCHPRYIKDRRHRIEYDYYSLGLVLLEIGHWRTLKSMAKGRAPEKVTEYLLREYVSDLDSKMGHEYQAVVKTCLTLGVGPADSAGMTAQEFMQSFSERTLRRLEKCHV